MTVRDQVSRETAVVAAGELSFLHAGSGPPIVFLHGIPTGSELWREVLGLVGERGHCGLAPDLPGYGATQLAAWADHSLLGSAELVAAWLTTADLAPAWVVGHDSGGAIAQLLATRHGDTVSRLTLVNSITDGSWPAPRARLATRCARLGLYRPAARVGVVPNAVMRWQVRRALGAPEQVSAATLDRVVWDGKFSAANGRAAFERHLAALTPRDTASLAQDLPELDLPTQIVWGLRDPFQRWSRAGRRLRSLLPSAALHTLPESGHLVPLEQPAALVDALLAWRDDNG